MKNRSFSLFESAIRSPQTKDVYTYSLEEFKKFSKIKEYDDFTKLSSNRIQKLLENYVLNLKDRKLKSLTIRNKLSAVELFLEMNKIAYHKKIIHKLIPSSDYISGGQKPFTTEEIQRMLNATTKLRTEALIHFLASTGARPSSLSDPVLTIKHLEDMPNGCKSVKIYDGSKEGYWGFLTPEASKAMNKFLNHRKFNGEEIGPESPVFTNTDKPIHTKKENFLSAKSVRQILRNIMKQAGIERTKDGKRYDKAVSYGFRKRFNTILKLNNDVNSNIAEKLMAHKRGLDGTYLQPTREECFTEFSKAIPQLTISNESRQNFKILELEKEKSEIETLKQQIGSIRKEMDEEVRYRSAITDYYETGDTKDLKDLDPEVIEFWGYWRALMASGNLPSTFSTPKEELLRLAKRYPKLAQLIGKKGENLVPAGKLLKVKTTNDIFHQIK